MTHIEGPPKPNEDYMSYTDFFKTRMEVTKAYCEGAKGFIQLSAAALALPLVFTQAILGKDVAEKGLQGVDRIRFWTLAVAWCSFVVAIVFGTAYQWLAPRREWDDLHRHPEHMKRYRGLIHKWPTSRAWDWLDRSIPYFVMIAAFCIGAVSFALYAANTMGLW
jgi:ABC-type Fe3+-siderophore transport system permease subunit